MMVMRCDDIIIYLLLLLFYDNHYDDDDDDMIARVEVHIPPQFAAYYQPCETTLCYFRAWPA